LKTDFITELVSDFGRRIWFLILKTKLKAEL